MTDFEQIYRENFPRVYGFLMRLCRNEALAEELAQETFFRALHSISRFDGRCRVDVWLCQIAKNAYFPFAGGKGSVRMRRRRSSIVRIR